MPDSSTSTLVTNLHEGIERCNVDLILGCFSEDAELRIIDSDHPPSEPLSLQGKNAIGSYYRDICSRDMKHRIDNEVVGDSHLALMESCQYPDGTRVLASEMFDLSDGKIFRATTVQAWDA